MTILISFFTLVMGIIIARLSSNLIKRIIRETNSHKLLKNKFKKVSSLDKILPNLTRIVIYLITINVIEGKIKRISIFEVTILTKKKELISIPNIDLLKKL